MYLKEFFLHPLVTGSVAPSSKYVAQEYVHLAELDDKKLVVELGPGNGCISKNLLPALPEGTDYFAIEINNHLVEQYKKNCPQGIIYQDTMQNVPQYLEMHGSTQCDCIISGIPWTNFSLHQQKEFVDIIYSALEPGGLFLTIVYFHSPYLRTSKNFKKIIDQKFKTVEISPLIYRNIPPTYIYVCRK